MGKPTDTLFFSMDKHFYDKIEARAELERFFCH